MDVKIQDEVIVQMLTILKESGAKNQMATLHKLLCIYESSQLPWEDRTNIKPRLEDTIKLVQRFKEGDRSVTAELKKRKIM